MTAKTNFQLGDANTMILRYTLEKQKRDHDFIGGNTLKSAGAKNTNKIHSFIVKDTAMFGVNKLNEFLVLYQYFKNDITLRTTAGRESRLPTSSSARTPTRRSRPSRSESRSRTTSRSARRAGRRPRLQGGRRDHQSHYGGFFIPTLYGYFTFTDARPTLDRYLNSFADNFSGSAGQRGQRQLDLRGGLPPGRLEAHEQPDREPGTPLRSADGPTITTGTRRR